MWSLMASAPALLLGVMGIVGRTQVNTWEFESYSPKENLALLAYQEPLFAAAGLKNLEEFSPSAQKRTNEAIDLWLERHRIGELSDILPGSLEDQGSSGPKAQISEARQLLITRLHISASAALEQGDAFGYCLDHSKIVALADVSKYSGITTVQQAALVQVGSLRRIGGHWPKLKPDQQEEIRSMLRRAKRADFPMFTLAERLSHLSIRRKLTHNVSMKDMNSVFHASHLANLTVPEGGRIVDIKSASHQLGLDPDLGITLSAAMKAEEKFLAIHEEITNLEADYKPSEPWIAEPLLR